MKLMASAIVTLFATIALAQAGGSATTTTTAPTAPAPNHAMAPSTTTTTTTASAQTAAHDDKKTCEGKKGSALRKCEAEMKKASKTH